jgi:hypothetical protein
MARSAENRPSAPVRVSTLLVELPSVAVTFAGRVAGKPVPSTVIFVAVGWERRSEGVGVTVAVVAEVVDGAGAVAVVECPSCDVIGALVVGWLVIGALVIGALVVGALVMGALVVGVLVVGVLVDPPVGAGGMEPAGSVVVMPGGIRVSVTVSQNRSAQMQFFISASRAAGFQAFMKSACSVKGLFIDARVIVPLVSPLVKRAARVSCGICTGWAASQT